MLSSIVAATGSQAGTQTEPSSGARLAALCAACHRLDNKPNGIPPVVSLSREEIIAMMRGFKARPRPSAIMHVVGSALADAEIIDVADYLAGLTRPKAR